MSLNEFSKAIIKDIEGKEAKRQREMQRVREEEERRAELARAEQEQRRLQHEAAVQDAVDELLGFQSLIKKAEKTLSVDAYLIIFSRLEEQVQSNPYYVAGEATSYREILEEDIKKAKIQQEINQLKREQGQRDFIACFKLLSAQSKMPSDNELYIQTYRFCEKMKVLFSKYVEKPDQMKPILPVMEFFLSIIKDCDCKGDWDCMRECLFNKVRKNKQRIYREALSGSSYEWMIPYF